MPDSSNLPETVDRLNRFPYRYGIEFVKTLYHTGGWQKVDEAYANPPTTTEQIIHPDKYFEQEAAKPVEAPPLSEDGWSLEKTDSFGEYFVRVMVDNWFSNGDAEEAATGWGGDLVSYYEKDDQFLFTWNIVWDSKGDASEFYLAFQTMMYKASAEKHNGSYWSANGRYISIIPNENQTLIISSPDESLVQQQFFE
jgi:hypothetical protein